MEECTITFLPGNKTIRLPRGSTILKAANLAGVQINAICGGEGICGRCKVIIESGECTSADTPFLTKEEVEMGYCLACLTLVEGDMLIRIPVETKVVKGKILTGISENNETIEVGGFELTPRTKKLFLELEPPTLNDNISDFDRLNRELKKNNFPNSTCNLPILKKLGNVIRKKSGKITVTILETDCVQEIIDLEPGHSTKRHFGLAIDIGTTSIVVYLVDLLNGKIVDVASDYNPQIQCGADIISRIIFSMQKDGLDTLHNLVIKTINDLIIKLLKTRNISQKLVDSMVVAGNTTMTHLFLGLDPRHIREEPYIPMVTHVPLLKAKDIGISINKNAYVYCIPSVSSYIGGDITSGVLASQLYKKKELTMFIDIGTNGEIILGNSEWMVGASCSAGPAFEGGGIKFGMRAVDGAIEGIVINPDTHDPIYSTIGGLKPKGICGSGIIDAVAELFIKGVINQKGKIQKDIKTNRIRENDGHM
ncbi:DUF4445 domain-containing protein, partial [Candidatus Desantisbacteria bacterium]|nr:DUF4445 domain-containing protein [Candidatus Desantisbacteria bacterium]